MFHLSVSSSDIVMLIDPLSRPLFTEGVPTEHFDIKSVNNLEVFVCQDEQAIEMFIYTYFEPKQFLALNIKFEEGLTCKCVVDGANTIMTMVDIAALQLCSDGKVLIILIHRNSMSPPYSGLLVPMCFFNTVCPLSVQHVLEESTIWKYEVGIAGDVSLLAKYMGISTRSCFDIGYLTKTIHAESWILHEDNNHFH